MTGFINQVYTIEGTQFSTVESLRAISRAKEEAQKSKSAKRVYLNGNPLYLIDRKGNLVSA